MSDPFFYIYLFLPFTGESSKMFGNCSLMSIYVGGNLMATCLDGLVDAKVTTYLGSSRLCRESYVAFLSYVMRTFFLCWCGSRISCKTGVSEILIKQD